MSEISRCIFGHACITVKHVFQRKVVMSSDVEELRRELELTHPQFCLARRPKTEPVDVLQEILAAGLEPELEQRLAIWLIVDAATWLCPRTGALFEESAHRWSF